MPSFTEFPLESSKPDFNITLPVGTHILELIAVDNAGSESEPVTVIVVVEPDTGKGPVIDDFAPKWLNAGQQADPFVIKGWRLQQSDSEPGPASETKVEFLMDNDLPDPSIRVRVKPESTTEVLELVVDVFGDAKVGRRRLRITTPDGTEWAPSPFSVNQA